jgi:serine/threonine protein kinase
MLINELLAMQRLEHSFIIRLHFAFHDRMSCFLVLDLKTGGDLRHYLRKRIIFDEDDVAFYIACISAALDHIHSRKIIHRDVKPENIILDSAGFPHLTDFGVAYVGAESHGSLSTNLASGTKQ